MKARTFRFEESDLELLKQLANDMGCSQADAIRSAIRSAIHETPTCNTSATSEKTVLIEQLAIKDEQIRDLTQALLNAQESVKAAQLLHANEKTNVLEVEAVSRSRWQKIKDAFKK